MRRRVPGSNAGGDRRSDDASHDGASDRDGGGVRWHEPHYAARRGRLVLENGPYWPRGQALKR